MTLRLILGVDPGQSGAIAAIADGEPAGFIDMPTLERTGGDGRRVDGKRLAALVRVMLQQHSGAHVVAVIERVQGMPTDGAMRAFRFGQADGIARGVLEALGLNALEVEPPAWKRHHGLIGSDKDAARHLVIARWPRIGVQLLQAKNSGRADAMLIAAWANENEAWIPGPPAPTKPKRRKKRSTAATPHPRRKRAATSSTDGAGDGQR